METLQQRADSARVIVVSDSFSDFSCSQGVCASAIAGTAATDAHNIHRIMSQSRETPDLDSQPKTCGLHNSTANDRCRALVTGSNPRKRPPRSRPTPARTDSSTDFPSQPVGLVPEFDPQSPLRSASAGTSRSKPNTSIPDPGSTRCPHHQISLIPQYPAVVARLILCPGKARSELGAIALLGRRKYPCGPASYCTPSS